MRTLGGGGWCDSNEPQARTLQYGPNSSSHRVHVHTEQPSPTALAHFSPATAGLKWHRAESGLSGAVVWRGEDTTGTPRVALKGWPLSTAAERIEHVHLWLSQAAHLSFVPTVFKSVRKQSAVLVDGRVWDACRWLPGTPCEVPTVAEVRAACTAVAQIHLCWPALEDRRPCRGVVARLAILTDHRALLDDWNHTLPPFVPELDPLLRRAVQEVLRVADSATAVLRSWAAWPLPVRPCVRDLRGEHVLFEAERVTGIVDYGAMAVDHPAVDLARLLDDYASSDDNLFGEGLDAYRKEGAPLSLEVPDKFVRLLANTGAVCSILGWLVRFFVRREPVLRPAATAVRLWELLARVEHITHF